MADDRQLGDLHVLQLKPNGLALAQANLARQGFDTLMPMRQVQQQSRYGPRSVKRPLFPGYLFFSSARNSVNWRAVANTRGVTRVITGADGQPAQLPREIADGLIAITTDDGMLVAAFDYEVGDQVSVIKGPFAGWFAKVLSTHEDGRIQLLVEVMGRETTVSISDHDLERRG